MWGLVQLFSAHLVYHLTSLSCPRSGDFILVGESSSSSGSDFGVTSGAMMILVALGLFICCFFFCYFVPKRLRENARYVVEGVVPLE